MKEILLRGPNGERWITEGRPFRFLDGEKIVEDQLGNTIMRGGNDLTSIVNSEGLLIGNIIKKITNSLGIKQCLKCKQRQLRYNQRGLEIQTKIKRVIGL